MTMYEVIATILGALGLVGGAIGYFSARSANATAEDAQKKAAEALSR
jgi:hypothetical protein